MTALFDIAFNVVLLHVVRPQGVFSQVAARI
jgi:hypothetical protein